MPVLKIISSGFNRLKSNPAYLLLQASDKRFTDARSSVFTRQTGWWVLGWGVLTGLLLCWIWGVVWAVLADYGVLIRPAGLTACFFLVFPCRGGINGLSLSLGFSRKWLENAAAMIAAVVVTISFVYLKPDWYRNEYALGYWVEWARPAAKIYRVLFLMPVWGAWASLISLQFARPDRQSPAAMRVFARKTSPVFAAVSGLLPLVLSIFYFHYLGIGAQITIAAVTGFTAVFATVILSAINSRVSRETMLAGNMLTQIAFIVTFLNFQ